MNRVLPLHDLEANLPTISGAIRLQAALHPERTAIIWSGRPPLSFAGLADSVERIGDDLHAAGIGAVISFGSTTQSPSSQRNEVPDYLGL